MKKKAVAAMMSFVLLFGMCLSACGKTDKAPEISSSQAETETKEPEVTEPESEGASHALIGTSIDSEAEADTVAAIENIGGMFMYYYNANQLDAAAKLFLDSEDTSFMWSAREKELVSFAEIGKTMSEVQAERAEQDELRDIHLIVSPIFEVSADGKTAYGSWDTYSYQVHEDDSGQRAMEFYTTRVDMQFVQDTAQDWKIEKMSWLEMLSFEPKPYDVEKYPQYANYLTKIASAPVPEVLPSDISGEDYVLAEQLQNLFTQNNRSDAKDLFAQQEDTSLYLGNLAYTDDDLFGDKKAVTGYDAVADKLSQISEAEAENGYDFITVPLMTTPVIQISEDGNTMEGHWLAQTVDVKATYYGCKYDSLFDDKGEKNEDAMIGVVRSICDVSQEFVKAKDGWKIKTYSVEPLLTMPVDEYRWSNIAGFGHHSMQNSNAETSFPYITLDDEWTDYDDDYDYEPASAEDSMEIQGFIARWANANKRRETLVYLDNLMAADNENLYTFMKNSSDKPSVGYDNGVYAFMEKQTQNWNETLSIGHSGTTPLVYTYTDKDGVEHAIGYWIDHSWTNLAQVFGTDVTEPTIPFMVNINRYRHEFIKENGEWKMLGFGFEPLIELPQWTFAWDSCRGWGNLGLGAFVDANDDLRYPQSFDLLNDDIADKYYDAVTENEK